MDFNLEFWRLYNRVSYRLAEWDSPEWSHKGRDSYRDSYITELKRAWDVFANNPEFSAKLPDSECDPIIGLTRIYNLCHQIIKDKTTQKKPTGTGLEKEAINKPNGKSHKIFGDKFEVCGLSINYKNFWHKVKNWPCVARGIKKIRKLFRR